MVSLNRIFYRPETIWHQIVTWNFTFGVKAGIIGVSIYLVVTSLLVRRCSLKF